MAILNKIYTAAVAILVALLATGCDQDFEPDIKSTPVLCINSLVEPSDTVYFELTRTWRWDEGDPRHKLDVLIKDAKVDLWVNGEFRESLEFGEWISGKLDYSVTPATYRREGYLSHYVARPGDEVKVVAFHDTYGEAESSVRVPQPIVIDDVEIDVSNFQRTVDADGRLDCTMDLNLRVWFTDPAETTDYYQFDVDWENPPTVWEGDVRTWEHVNFTLNDIDYGREPLFTEHVSPLEGAVSETGGYTIFSDRQISGKRYPLHIGITNVHYSRYNPYSKPELETSRLELKLNVVSQSYYKHVLSVWQSNDGINGILGSVGLGDPVWEASNVSTGAGVVAASSPCVFSVNMEALVAKY